MPKRSHYAPSILCQPLTEIERTFNAQVVKHHVLKSSDLTVFPPQEQVAINDKMPTLIPQMIARYDTEAVLKSDVLRPS